MSGEHIHEHHVQYVSGSLSTTGLQYYTCTEYVLWCRDALGSLKAVKKKVFVDERWSQSRNVTAIDWSSYVSICSTIYTPPGLSFIAHM